MKEKHFLFSIDLEDILRRMKDGHQYPSRVEKNMDRFLRFADDFNFRFTAFTVGDVAEHFPGLLKRIHQMGHEIACHSHKHITLNQFNVQQFRLDLAKNITAIRDCGIEDTKGYRAPVFSITPDNASWIYPALKEAGIEYSSSVLPASNPLFGWKGFGQRPRMMKGGVVELPLTMANLGLIKVPLAGGVYFRVLPLTLLKLAHGNFYKRNDYAITSYLHPYDIDTEQDKFMHPDINSRFYNYLMYKNRDTVFEKLTALLNKGCKVTSYWEYVQQLKESNYV